MADHSHRDPRHYNGPPPRDAAYADIFGAAPSGRTQTMTSHHGQPSYAPASGRSQTMTSASAHMAYGMQQPQARQYPQQYQQPHPQQQPQPRYPPPRQNGYPPQLQPGGGMNGYPPQQPGRVPAHSYNLPPAHAERRPYAQPTRVPPPNGGPQAPQRYYPAPGAALNSDPYRSRSMAAASPPSNFAPLQRPGTGQGHVSRTTAQGRIVPERNEDRTMSLTNYPSSRDHVQTMSGRIVPHIPHRRKGSNEGNYAPPSQQNQQRFNSMTSSREIASFASRQRTPSMASTSSSITAVGPPGTPQSYSNEMSYRSQVAKSTSSLASNMSGSTTVPAHHQQYQDVDDRQARARQRAPLVYPALLSKVADVFINKTLLHDCVKNELTYKSAFTGEEGVNLISYIIKTNDRNLALLLGRALDAQKLFHDVEYAHRLRDSPMEAYQFKDGMMEEKDKHDVNGVFTLLTECYSPTCTPNQLCYSIACPRRLEQQARLNLKPQPGLKRQESRASLHAEDDKEQKLWIHSVPKEIAETVSDKEKKRQEVICEVIYTERDFVKDLEYLRDFWMKPLRSTNPAKPSPIPEHRREKFIRTVFGNVLEVHAVNARLAEALTLRQQQAPVVEHIGDIFLEFVPLFEPFIKYGANQLYGKFEFEKEKSSNPEFARFVEETERMKESRKLELNGYLTKPTTRLARYPLLLEAVLKPTTEDNPDKKDLPKAIAMIKEFLTRVNAESGKAENHFNLVQLSQQLSFRPGEQVDLKLTEEGRQMIYKGTLKRPDNGGDITCYLFDHCLLLVRIKTVNKKETYKVYRKPIPLELLVLSQGEGTPPTVNLVKRPTSSLIPGAKNTPSKSGKEKEKDNDYNSKEKGYPITFTHLGKRGYVMPLFAASAVQRRKWIEHIEAQQASLRERSAFFNQSIICQGSFSSGNRVNCLVPVDSGRKLVYGTDTGIYVSERHNPNNAPIIPKKVIEVNKVDQVDVLEQFSMILLLSEKTLMQVPIEGLDVNDMTLANKRPKKIMGHTHFFKAGICLGKILVCCVKSTPMTSTIKVLEPQDTLGRTTRQPAFRRLLQGGQEALKPFKEIYVPAESTSIHFLKSKLCIGCARGFEVVSMETLETQSLLDPADTSLDFISRKENVKPIAIYRLNGEFLLNYSDFSFYVNRNGWRARPDWQIAWEGQPAAFALQFPYIVAFEPSFIEIRHVDTGALVHIITGKNIRMLHESTREILYAYEDEITGDDVIAALDFWPNKQ